MAMGSSKCASGHLVSCSRVGGLIRRCEVYVCYGGQVKELAAVLREASAEFPQLAEHASFLDE